jgi:hypothetical protein
MNSHFLSLKNIRLLLSKTVNNEINDSYDEKSMDDEEFAIFARRLRRFFKFLEKPKGDSIGVILGRRERENNPSGIQCHECGGYGHSRVKCAN